MNKIMLEEAENVKDLWVYYDSLLLFDKHITEKVNKTYIMLEKNKGN